MRTNTKNKSGNDHFKINEAEIHSGKENKNGNKEENDYSNTINNNSISPNPKQSKFNLKNENKTINESKKDDQTGIFDSNTRRNFIKEENKFFKGKEESYNEQNYEPYYGIQLEEKARIYQLEVEDGTLIPRRFKDFLELSEGVKNQYGIIKKKLQIIDCLLCLTGFTTITLAVVDNSTVVTYYNVFESKFELTSSINTIRILVMIFNIIGIIIIVSRYNLLLFLHKIRIGSIADRDSLSNAGLLGKLIFEVILNFIFIPPYVDDYFIMNGSISANYLYYTRFNLANLYPKDDPTKNSLRADDKSVKLYYNIATILTFFILFRIYHFFRLVHTFSYWATPRAHSICKLMNTNADVTFGIRAYLKTSPFISLTFALCFIIVIFGIAEQLFEFYNSQMIDFLDNQNSFVATMQKFSNIYNSLWVILVTMTTIGYGDIYPTTYFGRIIAVLACIVGTFIISLLVVFLNNSIAFDEVEKHIYNTVIEEQTNPLYLKKEASALIGSILRYNFLKKTQPEKSTLYRLFLWIEMKYNTKKFKINRITFKKAEIDIDGLLNSIKYKIDTGVTPIKSALELYNKTRMTTDNSLANLKDSNHVSDKMLKNSVQMWNLLKVLNKDKYLDGLNSVDEVYDSQVNVIEEILYYHHYKDKLANDAGNKSERSSEDSSQLSDLSEDESPNIGEGKFKSVLNRDPTKNESESIDE